MFENFEGFRPLNEEQIRELWNNENTRFVFDANLILSLFGLKEENANRFLQILSNDSIKNRIWEPYDISYVVLMLRQRYIQDEIEKINKALTQLGNFSASITNTKSNPYLSDELQNDFMLLHDKISDKLNTDLWRMEKSLKDSNLIKKMDALFKSSNEIYNKAQLDKIFKRAEQRYAKEMTPYSGFFGSTDRLLYHDYIVWKEMQYHAGKFKRNIIMIRGKVTEDWFIMANGDVLGPNPILPGEFYRETHEDFNFGAVIYNMNVCEFIKRCCNYHVITEFNDDMMEQFKGRLNMPQQDYNNIVGFENSSSGATDDSSLDFDTSV